MNPDKPYNDLPLLPPSIQLETIKVLKKAIDANRALAELKGAVKSLPNQDIFLNGIVLQEARLSSEIENIVTTTDELYRAEDDNSVTNPYSKEVLRYREAVWHGFKSIQKNPCPLSFLLKLQKLLKERVSGFAQCQG